MPLTNKSASTNIVLNYGASPMVWWRRKNRFSLRKSLTSFLAATRASRSVSISSFAGRKLCRYNLLSSSLNTWKFVSHSSFAYIIQFSILQTRISFELFQRFTLFCELLHLKPKWKNHVTLVLKVGVFFLRQMDASIVFRLC